MVLATPKNVPLFSCVGYAFGRKLREELKDVPIGLIQGPSVRPVPRRG